MLADSAHIQETDAAYQTKKNLRVGLPEVKPAYTMEDAENVMNTSGFDDDGGLDYEPEDVPSKLFGPLAGS